MSVESTHVLYFPGQFKGDGRVLQDSLFRSMMDHAPFLCSLKDEQGHYVFCNRRWIERAQVGEAGWIGKTDLDLLPKHIADAHLRDEQQVLDGVSPTVVRTEEAIEGDGSTTHWKSHRFLCVDAQGRKLIACVTIDVTQDSQREAALRRAHTELKEANAQLQELVATDALTGLRNRRAFEERLAVEISIARRKGRPLAVVLLDADNFKLVNDLHGHAAGDLTLIEMARVLKTSIRLPDFAARYGGEEFAVIMPENSSEGAEAWAHRFEGLLRGAAWDYEPVTVSMGIAELEERTCDAAELIRAADEALYQAKRRGRARVVIFDRASALGGPSWGLPE